MKSPKHPLSQSYFVISVMPRVFFFGNCCRNPCKSRYNFVNHNIIVTFFMCCISFVQGWISGEGAWRGPLESNCWIRNNTSAATFLCKLMHVDPAFYHRCCLSPISALRLPLVMLVICRSTVSTEQVREAFYAIPIPQSLGMVQALT